jgi:hypothetical protein
MLESAINSRNIEGLNIETPNGYIDISFFTSSAILSWDIHKSDYSPPIPAIRHRGFEHNTKVSAPKYSLATLLQSVAVTVFHHLFQQAPHGRYSIHQGVKFLELSPGQLSPTFGSPSDIAETEEQLPDLIQSEPNLTGSLDYCESIEHCGIVTPLSTDSLARKKYANPLVVTYGGGLESDLSRNFGNR